MEEIDCMSFKCSLIFFKLRLLFLLSLFFSILSGFFLIDNLIGLSVAHDWKLPIGYVVTS